jgi:hypothetical protein
MLEKKFSLMKKLVEKKLEEDNDEKACIAMMK